MILFIGLILLIVFIVVAASKGKNNNTPYSESNIKTIEKGSIDITLKRIEPPKHSDTIPYGKYDEYLKSLTPDNLNIEQAIPRELTSTEKYLLKALDDASVMRLYVARYWYYTYNIDLKASLELFLKMNLLEMRYDFLLENLKVQELKEILLSKGLNKSGKKQDLINRILDNFSKEELYKLSIKEIYHYKLTDSGKKITDELCRSATYNLELEDACISLILQEKYNDAYAKVCKFRSSSPIPSGLNYDWNAACQRGWNKRILDKTSEKSKMYSACTIFCEMMGEAFAKADILYKRLTNETYVLTPEEAKAIPVSQYRFYHSNKNELISYRQAGIEYYQILAVNDAKTCEKCKRKHNKIYPVKSARIGVNMPPFEYDCRCTTTAVIE